jgi:3-methyladenine DNA glycosylase/8-oxoguanine DNA glycosylase
VPFTLSNIKEDLEDIGPRFEGAPDPGVPRGDQGARAREIRPELGPRSGLDPCVKLSSRRVRSRGAGARAAPAVCSSGSPGLASPSRRGESRESASAAAIAEALGRDEVIGGLVRARPGLRVPGCVDGDELALRAVLGQHVSMKAARTRTARLVETFGTPLEQPLGTVTHRFPAAAVLAEADPAALAGLGPRRETLQTLAARLANGEVRIDGGSDPTEALTRLLAIPGIGPWTAAYVAMRGFHDPDAFPHDDAGLRHALTALGRPDDPRSLAVLQQRWRPWRAYAALHLWTSRDQ